VGRKDFIDYAYESGEGNTVLKLLAVDTMVFWINASEIEPLHQGPSSGLGGRLDDGLKAETLNGKRGLWGAESKVVNRTRSATFGTPPNAPWTPRPKVTNIPYRRISTGQHWKSSTFKEGGAALVGRADWAVIFIF
jgi:hypothetical protein